MHNDQPVPASSKCRSRWYVHMKSAFQFIIETFQVNMVHQHDKKALYLVSTLTFSNHCKSANSWVYWLRASFNSVLSVSTWEKKYRRFSHFNSQHQFDLNGIIESTRGCMWHYYWSKYASTWSHLIRFRWKKQIEYRVRCE